MIGNTEELTFQVDQLDLRKYICLQLKPRMRLVTIRSLAIMLKMDVCNSISSRKWREKTCDLEQ